MLLTSTERRQLEALASELARDNPRLARALSGRWYRLRRLGRALAMPHGVCDGRTRALGYLAVLLIAAGGPLLVVSALLVLPVLIAVAAVAVINGPLLLLLVQLRQARLRRRTAGGQG